MNKCPKCNSILRTESTMHRATEGSFSSPYTEAISCLICGFWRALDVPTVKPDKIPKGRMEVAPSKPASDASLLIVAPFIPSIKALRTGKVPASWITIAKLIRHATQTRVTPKTIKRCYFTATGEI